MGSWYIHDDDSASTKPIVRAWSSWFRPLRAFGQVAPPIGSNTSEPAFALSQMPTTHYDRPTDRRQALELLSDPGALPIGGGTDLVGAMRDGLVSPTRLVDLRTVPGFDTIAWSNGGVRIGAGVHIATLASDEAIGVAFPALANACDAVGSPALRNMGTIGGNLCQRPRCWYFRSGVPCFKSGGTDCPAAGGANHHLAILGGGPCFAVHASDPAVALVALDAVIHVAGPDGDRIVPLEQFLVGPVPDPRRENTLASGEVVIAVELPAAASRGRQWFSKVIQRGAWDFALASVAVARRTDGGVRLVLGGVAPTPWRINASVEEDVAAGPLGPDDLEALAERALYDAQPLSNNAYKVDVARSLLKEAMARASSA